MLFDAWLIVIISKYGNRRSLLFLDRKEKLELGRKLFFRIKPVWEVNASNSAIGVNGDPQSFNIIASVCSACEIWKIELNLIPSFVKSHGHGAYKRLHTSCALIIWCTESSTNVFIVEDLYFKREILLELHECMCTFLMIMTRKGNLMPSVSLSFWGQVMKAVVTLVPMISRTELWISWSVMRLMCPLWTVWRDFYFVYPRFEVVCFRWNRELRGSLTGMCSWTLCNFYYKVKRIYIWIDLHLTS